MTHTVALLLGAASAVPASASFLSTFDTGTEGWTIQTRTNPAGSFSLSATYVPDAVALGGDPDAYLSEVDPDNQWSFFAAPEAWLGDRSPFSGGQLRYSIRTDALTFPDGRLVVLIGSGGQEISYNTGLPPLNTWTRRVLPLSEGAWRVGTDATGAAAPQSQIDAVLGDLEAVLIGMEFGADLLEEVVGLDSVRLLNCPADVNGDGAATPADFTAWLSIFNNQATATEAEFALADVNGDGSITPADFTAWLAAFNSGLCI